jgi:hypothetical protein
MRDNDGGETIVIKGYSSNNLKQSTAIRMYFL